MTIDQVTTITLLRFEVERLLLENWQLKGALGYPVPGDIPPGPFRCGMCAARELSTNLGPDYKWGKDDVSGTA